MSARTVQEVENLASTTTSNSKRRGRSTIPLVEPDDDLILLLNRATSTELEPLVEFLTKPWSSELKRSAIYRHHRPNHDEYVLEIAAEIQKFGANSWRNVTRGGRGISYSRIAREVASRVGAKIEKTDDIQQVETKITCNVLAEATKKMTPAERRDFILAMDIGKGVDGTIPITVEVMQGVVRSSGFAPYKLLVCIANALSKELLNRGLPFVVNAFLTEALGIFASPICSALVLAWAAYRWAGPRYKVVVPCVLYVAFLRVHIPVREQRQSEIIDRWVNDTLRLLRT
jgi:uncharacterized protein YaaW (UPF0174 family)